MTYFYCFSENVFSKTITLDCDDEYYIEICIVDESDNKRNPEFCKKWKITKGSLEYTDETEFKLCHNSNVNVHSGSTQTEACLLEIENMEISCKFEKQDFIGGDDSIVYVNYRISELESLYSTKKLGRINIYFFHS